MLHRILHPLRCVLTVTVAPDRVTVADREATTEVAPLVRLAADGKIVELGDSALAPDQGGCLVRLFEGHVHGGSWSEEPALTTFFRYHLTVHNERILLRPLVRLRGVPAFSQLMAGGEREIFGRSLLAGAAEVAYLDAERELDRASPAA